MVRSEDESGTQSPRRCLHNFFSALAVLPRCDVLEVRINRRLGVAPRLRPIFNTRCTPHYYYPSPSSAERVIDPHVRQVTGSRR
jgi:hypothetical protein